MHASHASELPLGAFWRVSVHNNSYNSDAARTQYERYGGDGGGGG
jgi:hypothetical protein